MANEPSREVPTSEGWWWREGSYPESNGVPIAVEVYAGDVGILHWGCWWTETDPTITDDGLWLCEIPSASELAWMRAALRAAEEALAGCEEREEEEYGAPCGTIVSALSQLREVTP